MTTSRSESADRTMKFSDRVSCPHHGPVMVLVIHRLSEMGRRWAGFGVVTFFRCTAVVTSTDARGQVTRAQCTYMRPNKYQQRPKGERRK